VKPYRAPLEVFARNDDSAVQASVAKRVRTAVFFIFAAWKGRRAFPSLNMLRWRAKAVKAYR
jgi:hypothetical protein